MKLAKRAEPQLTIFEIIFVRSLLSIAASVAAARGRPPLGQLRHAHLLALRGLLGTTAMALFYAALVRRVMGGGWGQLTSSLLRAQPCPCSRCRLGPRRSLSGQGLRSPCMLAAPLPLFIAANRFFCLAGSAWLRPRS